ncbi:hypothetical protein JAAARDRAFT_599105 [Jaapia argillacea MUCL 33604]|uniref:Uncharacterized protein n=1 Tax=Jaapia argillacea MUCL 33604 TaxID=933084 RepID=A0A067QC86_9AGAM|nr:hypothetical protein JAAARDRAFT_599105 [Jaapia argillacea MUCL 33604]
MHPRWKEGLSHTIVGLKAIEAAADFTPIPHVRLVAGLVLKLLESVDKVDKCKDDCESLASRTAQMVFTILSEAQSHGPLSSEMESRVMKLAEALNDTTQFMREQSKAPFLRRFLRQANTQAQIEEYRVRLEDTFRLFDSTSLIGVQRSLDQLQNTAEQTKNLQLVLSTDLRGLAKLHPSSVSEYDGDYRVFKCSDIDLLECLETTLSYSIEGTPLGIVRSDKASLGGRIVVVRTYEGAQSAEARLNDLRIFRELWHPTLPQLLGYSKETSAISFVVLKAATITVEEFLSNLDPISQLGHVCRITRESIAARTYLADRNLGQVGGDAFREISGRPALVLDQHGRFLLSSRILRLTSPACSFDDVRAAPDGFRQGSTFQFPVHYDQQVGSVRTLDVVAHRYLKVEKAVSKFIRGSLGASRPLLEQWLELLVNLPTPEVSVSSSLGPRGLKLGDVIFCDELSPSGDNIHSLLGHFDSSYYLCRLCGRYDEAEEVDTRPTEPLTCFRRGVENFQV